MKVRRILAASVLSTALLGAMAAPAFAADNGSGVVTGASITAGNRTAALAGNVTFAPVAALHADSSPADMPTSIEVNDLSGSHAGWTVTMASSVLTHTNGVATIAADNLSVDSFGTLTMVSGVDVENIETTTGALGTARTLISADELSGVGDYTQPFGLGLNVPADSLAGAYTGTVTVTIAPVA